ncbi:MAG: fibronectin type III domain-containing protein [Bacteroidales bacterium]|nr:fibronectin type III domain-containing protein [Bacteroidales bacterium]
MKKLINLVALAALLFVPWHATAQCTDGTPCQFTIVGNDSYGDGWEGSLTIYRNNAQLSTFTVDVDDNTQTFTVCQGDLIRIEWSGSDQYNENSFSITSADGSVNISNAHGRTYAPNGTVVEFAACPTCLPVRNLISTASDSASITVAWSDTSNSGATYSVACCNGNDTIWTTTSDTSYTFDNLSSNTLYTFLVRAICTSDDSSTALHASFRTACGNIQLPFTETFEGNTDGAFPPCWTLVRAHGTDPSVNSQYNSTPGGSLSMYMRALNDTAIFATPSAIPLPGNSIYVRYKAYMQGGNSNTWLKVGVVTNPNDMSTFVVLDSIIYHDFNYEFEEREFNTAALDANSTYWVAWAFYSDYGGYWYFSTAGIDDIYISEIPSCLRVTEVALDSASVDELYIHWVDNVNTGATYTVNYWANGSTDTLYVTASTTSTSLTGLNANTLYNVTITPNCADGDAESSPVYGFRTGCGATTLPFFVDFEDAAFNGAWYPCWDSTIHANTDPSVNNVFNHTDGGQYGMYLQATSSENYNLVVGPTMDATGNNIFCRFWANLQGGWIKAGVITNPRDTSTFVPLLTIQGVNGWNEYEFNTAALDATANYRIAWLCYNTASYGTAQIGGLDDIYISEIPSCLRVTNLAVNAADSASITLSWADTLNSGATYTVMVGDSVAATGVSELTYTVTDLNANTLYTFSVAVECGTETSEPQTISARTECGIIALPYVEGFESMSTNATPLCWSSLNGTVYVRSSSTHTGSNRLDFRESTNTIAVLPRFDQEVNTLQMSFWTRPEGNYSSCGSFSVGYMTNPNADSTFVELAIYNYTDFINGYNVEYGERNVMFNAAPEGAYIAFRHNANANNYYWYVDDINVEPLPDCVPVSLLAVDTVTATEATIHWSADANQSAWFVKVDSTVYDASDTIFTIPNLTASTTYTVYVAANCSGDTSSWQSVDLRTDCATGSCDIIVAADDSYGDGWNGAAIKFFQNGTEVASYAMPSGHNDTALVNVCAGTPVTFSWQTGSYDYETSYVIYDGAGTEVYSSANGGVNHSDSIANACPTCLTPTGVMATAIDSNNITFVWTELDDVSEYLISFNGDAYTTGYNGTEVYAGLTPNTVYTFSVKAVCVPGADTSAARTITVRTACGVMTLPYTNDFEAETSGNLPSCWNGTGATGSSYSGTYPAVSNTHAHSGNLAVRFEEISGTSIIATEPVPLNGDSIYVAFWGSVTNGWSGTVSLEAGVMTNVLADSTFIPLLTITGASDYALREFNTSSLTAYHDSTFHIAFRYVSNDTYSSADIDDINIRFNEGCMYPANLVATPGTDDVFLEWNTNGAIGTYAVEYRTVGGTWDSATTTDSSYTVTGLNPATAYEARVGFVCGTDTLWTVTSFQTNCALLPVPYAENFDAYANDVMPPCWGWNSSFATHWDGGVFLRGYHGGGSEYVVVPELDGAISKLKIEFDTKVGTIAENDGILIGVADAGGTLIAWLDTIQDVNFSRNAHVRKTVYFTNYNMPAGAARVAFAQLRNWDQWALIDNINIDVLPDCYPVDNLVGHNLDDIENTTFSWTPQGYATEWQVYVDTVTVGIDSLATLPDSLFTTVYDTFYTLPLGAVQGGGIYNFFVRSQCSATDHSGWVKNEFGAGTIIMNQTTDTVEGCGFVVYDNGGPIAGYLANTNTELVIRTENVGSQLQIFGAKFGFGMDAATLTVYDGEGTTGDVLYTYNTIDGRDTLLNTVLATSTTGSLTITFVVNGSMCHTGYELYIRCTDGALCPRPTELQAQMTSETTATATWTGTASNYNFYYRIAGSETWVRQNVNTNSVNLTGLVADTVYDMYVVAICSATDSSTASVVRQLRTYRSTPELEVFTVVVNSADATMGTATADHTGEVQENTVVTATATANSGYHFTNWTSNGNVVSTDNPYTFTLTADITLTANFEQDSTGHEGIDDIDANAIALYPNPATTTVTISGISGQATVSIVDMNGREVHTQAIKHSSNQTITLDLTGYAQGAYFVRITGEQQSAIRKLIVK